MSSQYERYADKLLVALDPRIRWISEMVRMIPENADHIKVGSKWVTAHGDVGEIVKVESDGWVWFCLTHEPFLQIRHHYSILIKELP